jgi:nucleoside-diphosphate kinase
MDHFAQDPRRYVQTERTLIVIKPDAVRRGLVGKIIQRFEDRSLKLIALELRTL